MRKYVWLGLAVFLALTGLYGIADLITGEDKLVSLLTIIMFIGLAYLCYRKYEVEKDNIPVYRHEPYSFQVVGYQYHQLELKSAFFNHGNVQNVEVFEGVELVPEPTNQHDKNAIMVKLDGIKVGYVPADRTHIVRSMLNRNKVLRLYEYKGYARAELTII